MFIFKKIFSQFLFPLPLALCLSIFGLYLLWFTTKQKTGKILVSISVFVLLIFSYGIVPDTLLVTLERKHEAYPTKKIFKKDEPVITDQQIKYVVVLGGGHTSDPNLPLTGQLGKEALVRLVEGVRIHRKHSGSKLILSGGSAFDPIANAIIMAELAGELGVSESNLLTETESMDTKDEARIIKNIIGSDPFVLVTSASHMPRSMAMFKKLGLEPIPAPTGHSVKESQGTSPGLFFPNASNLRKTEKAMYEYLGIIWAKLRGQIQ